MGNLAFGLPGWKLYFQQVEEKAVVCFCVEGGNNARMRFWSPGEFTGWVRLGPLYQTQIKFCPVPLCRTKIPPPLSLSLAERRTVVLTFLICFSCWFLRTCRTCHVWQISGFWKASRYETKGGGVASKENQKHTFHFHTNQILSARKEKQMISGQKQNLRKQSKLSSFFGDDCTDFNIWAPWPNA